MSPADSRMAGNKAHQARMFRDASQTLAIAEAGVGDMLAKMGTNYGYWAYTCPTNSSDFAMGSFAVSNNFVVIHTLL